MNITTLSLLAVAAVSVHAQSSIVPLPPQPNAIVGEYRLATSKDNGTPIPRTFVQPEDQIIPHLATGGGWETILVLVNIGSSTVSFTQRFFDPAGNPMNVTFRSIPGGVLTTTSAAQGTLSPNSSFNILLFDAGQPLQTGWSSIFYDSTNARIGGFAIFRNRTIVGQTDFEALVPMSAYDDYKFFFPFDNLEGFATAMAIVNPASNLTAHVTLTFRDTNGAAITTGTLTLAPNQHTAFTLGNDYPATGNRVGTVYVESDTNRLSGLGFRFNPKGAFATIPILNWIGMF